MNLMFDGFELCSGFSDGSPTRRWVVTQNFGNVASVSARTRTAGGAGLASNKSFTTAGKLTRALAATSNNHVFMGVGYITEGAFRNSADGGSSLLCVMYLTNGATAQIGWRPNTDGSISVYRGADTSATLIGTTAAGVLTAYATPTNADYKMVELDVVLATGGTGSVAVYVADIQVANFTGVQTANGAAQATHVVISAHNTNACNEHFDDAYVNDSTGSGPDNVRFGEAFAVGNAKPNAAGNYSQWTKGGSIGANNFNQVDDYDVFADTDYVKSETVNQIDSYGMSDQVATSATIIGVEHNMGAKKDDVANRAVAPFFRIGGTDYVGTPVTLDGTYRMLLERFMVSPATGVAWTLSEVNALESGQKLTT